MDIISNSVFDEICHHPDTKTLKFGRSRKQPKVFEVPDNIIIKIFYPKKKVFSSDRLKPYALRFRDNILSLRFHGYDVPQVIKIRYCTDSKIYLVYYHKIEGHDLRNLAKTGQTGPVSNVAKLVASLHQKGIFFRSIHLENLLCKPDGTLALLDITDVRFRLRPLSIYSRYRNLKHLLQEPNDREIWQAFGMGKFLQAYFSHAALPSFSHILLSFILKRVFKLSKTADTFLPHPPGS